MQQEPVVKDGVLSVGWRMKITMTCDHRVIDGAVGAQWLQEFKAVMQSPVSMLI